MQPHASAQGAVAAGSALCELHSTATQGRPLASFVSGAAQAAWQAARVIVPMKPPPPKIGLSRRSVAPCR